MTSFTRMFATAARTAAVLAIVCAVDGRASSLTIADEVAETMMTAQESGSIFLGTTFGTDASSSLHFAAGFDPIAQTFSYVALPGQTYEGLAFSMDTVGTFNAGLGEYDWTTTAALGGQTWIASGSGMWVGDPTLNVNSTYTYHGVTYTVTGAIPVDGAGHSEGTLTYTNPITGKSYNWASTDFFASNGLTVVHAVGFNEDYSLNGNLPAGGGVGNFDARIGSVPEPTTLTLVASGGLLIAVGRLRRRKGAPSSNQSSS